MDIAPYLVGTEEIAMFTMTILSDQLISANKLNLIALILAQCIPLEDGLTAMTTARASHAKLLSSSPGVLA